MNGCYYNNDIKILEQFLRGNKYCEDCKEKCVDCYIEYEEVQAVANLIKRYKELEEYNMKYIVQLTDEQYRNLVDIIRKEVNNEWKSKVIEKIEEYTNSILENLDEDRRWCDIELVDNFEALKKELLEE